MRIDDAMDGPDLLVSDAQRTVQNCSTQELRGMLRPSFNLAGRNFEPVMSQAARRELRRRGERA